jgi:hypothetical protein
VGRGLRVRVMVGLSVGVGEGTVAVGIGVSVGGGSVLVRVLEGRGWNGVRVLAQVGILVPGSTACGLLEGFGTVTAEIACGAKGRRAPKNTRQASKITPARPTKSTTFTRVFQVDCPLGISFYGSDTTISM